MKGKLEQYKIFKSVAESGSISATAKELYVSQSAVSQSIKILEDNLGVKLFSRSVRGVELTKDGEILYEYVAAALTMLDAGENKLNETKELTRGELVIGASNTLTECYLLPLLQNYHSEYPGVKIKILNGTSRRVMNYLDTGMVDLAFVTTNEKPEAYESYLCFRTHTAFVASKDYDMDFRKSYSLAEIAEMPLILLEKEAGSRRFLEDYFLGEGIRLQPEIELASYELLISLATIGLGIAAVTEEFSNEKIMAGLVKKIKVNAELPTRAVSMITSNKTEASMATQKFMEIVKTVHRRK